MSTFAVPGLWRPCGLFVLADGTCLVCAENALLVVAPLGLLPALTLAGQNGKSTAGRTAQPGTDSLLDTTAGITVDPVGQTVVTGLGSHDVRPVSKAGAVSRPPVPGRVLVLEGGGGGRFR